MVRSKHRKNRTRIEPLEVILEYMGSKGIEVMGPIQEGDRWTILVRPAGAPPGTPPVTIELHDIEGEGLYGEWKDVKAVVRSASQRHKPHRARSLRGHASWITIEQAFSRIADEEAHGHLGADGDTGHWRIDLARVIAYGPGQGQRLPLGSVPVETFPDGSQGVDERILEEALSADASVGGFEDDDEE